MAKKKTTTIVEEEEKEEAPEVEYKDIKDKNFKEVAADPEPEKKEEKETPKEEPKEEETEEIEFDPEQLKKEAKEEARQEMSDLLAGKSKEEAAEVKDDYEEFVEGYTKEHGTAPDWKVVAGFIKEKAKTELKAEQEAEAKQAEEKQTEEKKTQEAQQETVDKYVDSQFEDLYKTNRFPRVKNAEDPNDIGKKYRQSLADQTITINKNRLENGLPTKTLVEVFFTEFKAPNQQPAGGDAPVSAGRSGGSADNQEELDYVRDVRGSKSFFDILMRRK